MCFKDQSQLDIQSFLSEIDLLIVSNSSIGYEGILNKVPVWVYCTAKEAYANDHIMVQQAGCPDIYSSEALSIEIEKLLTSDSYLSDLLSLEEEFVLKQFYPVVGEDASKITIDLISKRLNGN